MKNNIQNRIFHLHNDNHINSTEAVYLCQCKCGRIVYIRESLLVNGIATGCPDCTGFEDDVICPDCGRPKSNK